jgi:restriction endonuclease Mrr
LGGSADLQDVKKAIFPLVKSRLSKGDFEIVSTGEERWWNAICWERSELKKAGLLLSSSPRGRWELSDAGWAKARRLAQQ